MLRNKGDMKFIGATSDLIVTLCVCVCMFVVWLVWFGVQH